MEELAKYFRDVSAKLDIMVNDMEKMIDEKKSGKQHQRKTLMPLTKIYKDEKEAKTAAESPDLAYVMKGIENAFKGQK